jgi:hypothetical protein
VTVAPILILGAGIRWVVDRVLSRQCD